MFISKTSWHKQLAFIILAIYQHLFMLQFVMNMQTLSFHLGGQTKILYQQLPFLYIYSALFIWAHV